MTQQTSPTVVPPPAPVSNEPAAASPHAVAGSLPIPHAVPVARPFPWFPYTLLFLLSAGVTATGVYLMYFLRPTPIDPGTVHEIRLSGKQGLDLRALEDAFGVPSYYLEIRTDLGNIRTATAKSTRVGNGLTFKMPVPLRLLDIREVKVWDENTLRKDTQVDRIDSPSRSTTGERFTFSLAGPEPAPPKDLKLGLYMTIAGGVALLLTVLAVVRAQAI